MGDFNADGSYFDEDSTLDIDEYNWVIDDSIDTTTKSTDFPDGFRLFYRGSRGVQV
jgi:hypothetical protein